jgi:hypothetical protein
MALPGTCMYASNQCLRTHHINTRRRWHQVCTYPDVAAGIGKQDKEAVLAVSAYLIMSTLAANVAFAKAEA